jgi:hypothetical protein
MEPIAPSAILDTRRTRGTNPVAQLVRYAPQDDSRQYRARRAGTVLVDSISRRWVQKRASNAGAIACRQEVRVYKSGTMVASAYVA